MRNTNSSMRQIVVQKTLDCNLVEYMESPAKTVTYIDNKLVRRKIFEILARLRSHVDA